MTKYQKPFLSLSEQIDLLRSRGMIITDDARAKHYLGKINYYRLSAYWHPFRKREANDKGGTNILDNFQEDVSFSNMLDLYVFDKRLRLIALDALERIEVALRTDLTIQLSKKDPLAHRKDQYLHGHFSRKLAYDKTKTTHAKWLDKLDYKAASSQEDFATHFRKKYPNEYMPTWVASELWDFGALSYLNEGMLFEDRDAVAAIYGVPTKKIFQSWVRCLNDVRNNCAHHSRLWNKPHTNQPIWTKEGEIPEFDHLIGDTRGQTRMYSALLIMCYMLRVISPNSTWCLGLLEHLASFPENTYVSLTNAGFPEGWQEMEVGT